MVGCAIEGDLVDGFTVNHAFEAEGSLVVVSGGPGVVIGLKDDGLLDDEGTSDDGSVRDDDATDGDDSDNTVLVEGGRSMGL